MLALGYSRKRRKALRLGEGCWMSWGCWGTQRVAPGTAGDILATFPQGFARQECAQQARGQIVTACRKYIYIYTLIYVFGNFPLCCTNSLAQTFNYRIS